MFFLSIYFRIWIGIVQVLFSHPYCGDFTRVVSLTNREDTVSQQNSWSSGFYHLFPLLESPALIDTPTAQSLQKALHFLCQFWWLNLVRRVAWKACRWLRHPPSQPSSLLLPVCALFILRSGCDSLCIFKLQKSLPLILIEYFTQWSVSYGWMHCL